MRNFIRSMCFATTAPVAVALALTAANAAESLRAPPPVVAPPGSDEAVRAYWTPQRIATAKTVDTMISGPLRHGPKHQSLGAATPLVIHGAGPSVDYDFSLESRTSNPQQEEERAKAPLVGTGAIPYTTNRLYPANDKQIYKIFPYATVGHLYFSEPSGNFQCSASVIRLSTIATAGHCMADGNGNYYSSWMFIPAHNNGATPYGTWTWSAGIVSSAWWTGAGGVPNEQDDGVLVIAEQKYKHHLHHIGDLTGYLGYEYDAALPTAISQLGYPCNLDSCSRPIATYSQDTAGPTNNFQWGTASFGGASGGPEVQDFGQAPSGVPSEILGGNILISSTSYTYTDTSVQVDGGSILYAPGQNGEYTFGDEINYACSVGGC